ncbi:MAG: 1,4-alpha-glucan branching protein GlgB [Planctomycetaceae bacterium]|nr:1,4-alpha-glucan branching protein GlgB [Planctomycetaceae bacterium]
MSRIVTTQRQRHRIAERTRSTSDGSVNASAESHQFTPAELAALQRGVNCSMYRVMGAHPEQRDGVSGTHFAVWAPNAQEVSVVCDRNGWQHNGFYLYGSNEGIWTGFYPDVGEGETYKYSLKTKTGDIIEKTDPYGFRFEHPPRTASIVCDVSGFAWNDSNWMNSRAQTDWSQKPVSIYEVHLGSWKRPWDNRPYHTYEELAKALCEYCHEMGFTHLQLMPITEYPFDGSWGYQATGYFAPTSRYGSPEEFHQFVDRCHQEGIGVLIDWVPAHFPTDAHSLGKFDGTSCYEHEDPKQGFHPDWNTYIFNYGRHEVRNFLLSSARFWCDVYHIDGIRVDAVASMLYLDYSREHGQWVPNRYGGRENLEAIQFLKDFNSSLHGEFPGILTIAEESTAWGGVSRPVYDGGLGFSMKWDMGWMNDSLKYIRRDSIYRKHHQNELSFRMIYAFTENFVLPLSHDEVVHGKGSLIDQMPGDEWQKFANLRVLYGYQYTTPGKPLLFMGGEFAQWKEWNHDSQLDWDLAQYDRHDGIRRLIGDLNRVTRETPALHEQDFLQEGFSWIQADDWQNSIFAFCRHGNDGDLAIVVLNFTPMSREKYIVGVPKAGGYREILNSDAKIYGGGNIGNAGLVMSKPVKMHGHPQSLELTIPPLAVIVLQAE